MLVLVSAGTEEDDVVVTRHENAITAAERDGVRHIVYTSLTDAGDHLGFALAHRWTERRLRSGTAQWTILRNGLYAELIGQLLAPREGVVSAPFGQGGVAAVARDNLAEAAAIIAWNPEKHQGKTYNLVGNTVITAQDLADTVGAEYRPGKLSTLRPALDSAPLLPFQSPMLLSIHSAARHGFLEETGTDITDILGREPVHPLHICRRRDRLTSREYGSHRVPNVPYLSSSLESKRPLIRSPRRDQCSPDIAAAASASRCSQTLISSSWCLMVSSPPKSPENFR